MKTKITMFVIITIAIILLLSIVIFAFEEGKSNVMSRMKKINEIETVEEISELNTVSQLNTSSNVEKTNRVKDYMKINQLIKEDESDLKVELVTNNFTNEKFYRMTGSGARIEILKNSGELRSYINSNPTDYVEGTIFEKEKIRNIANEILNTNDLFENNRGYKIIEIKEKSTFYPTVWFEDSLNNKLMFMILNPETKEILAIGTKTKPISEKNDIKVDSQTAKNIAIKQMNLSEGDVVSVLLSEVIPNDMFLEDGVSYSKVNIRRNAYIVSFNTEVDLQIYIDATTGEVIGGNCKW